MSTINSNITSLFTSMNSTSSSSMYSLDFNTLSSIKSGTYKQLLKNYYSKDSADETSESTSSSTTTNKTSTSSTISSAEKINATSLKDSSQAVLKDIKKLSSSALWEKKTTTDDEGNTTSDYDRDAIYKAVSQFTKDYNLVVEVADDSENESTLRTTSNMVSFTKVNSSLLSSVGITVNNDNTLSIDKDTLNKADVSTLKSLFSRDGSLGSQISSSVSTINTNSVTTLAKLAASGTYSSGGGYTYVTGSNYDSII